ncbi:MAG: glycine--tRNA ligase subunit beta [Hyphomicrobiaceae bacterium]
MPSTAELLIELFSEEIPARMQGRAAEDLKRLVIEGLAARGLQGGKAMAFATPRRLTLVVADVPGQSPAISDERKGPRVGAPEKAIEGFLKSAGLTSIDQAEVVEDAKKGSYYVARVHRPGQPAPTLIGDVLGEVIGKFPWPKSQRWGSGAVQWVRPLHSIICLYGGEVVPLLVGDVTSGRTTRGHRFHGNAPFEVANFEDYGTKLNAAKVLLPTSERVEMIREQAEALAGKAGLELVVDEGLLVENAGLTEWPTVLIGTFDEAFLEVPAECLTTSMRSHQKCFSLRDPKTGKLANRFLMVSNLVAADGGEQITTGNEKVIRARLSDARFFWTQDLKKKLEPMRQELGAITFHEKLGSQAERVDRITELARQIAGSVDAEPELAGRAAQLCKADLVSGMVGEFPELQGLMGRYYALAEHMNPKIAEALEAHYKPRGAGDGVPTSPVSIAVALADKLDTLVGFWAIDEKPTGSGDPYQLRRAALGIIRIVLDNDLRVPLLPLIKAQSRRVGVSLLRGLRDDLSQTEIERLELATQDLVSFFADRLKVHLREKGARHDLIDAVFALGDQDDLALMVKRVDALAAFLDSDDGANVLAGARRAANILAIEEKKEKRTFEGAYDIKLLKDKEELALAAAIESAKQDTVAAINVENFVGAMNALADLRAPVDAFFEKVTVNVPDAALRENRLKLLSEIRRVTLGVADFSRIAG